MYPLDDTDEIKHIPGMIEVLRRNQTLSFDPQLYDTEEVNLSLKPPLIVLSSDH